MLTKIHAKNEKINEIYLELKSKEVQLNSVRQQLNEKDAIIAAMESKKLPRWYKTWKSTTHFYSFRIIYL